MTTSSGSGKLLNSIKRPSFELHWFHDRTFEGELFVHEDGWVLGSSRKLKDAEEDGEEEQEGDESAAEVVQVNVRLSLVTNSVDLN